MKMPRLGIVALLAGGLAITGLIALAQTTSTNQTAKPKATAKTPTTPAAPASAQTRANRVATKLKLTPDQKAKLVPIFQEEIDKRAEVTKRRQAERDQIFQDFLTKIKTSGILTDAQYTNFLALETPASPTPPKAAAPKPTTPATPKPKAPDTEKE